MKSFFRKLPLAFKLILIGIIPILFIIFLSVQLYLEKSQQVRLIGDYITRIRESGNMRNLMDALQTERKYTYEYVLTKSMHDAVILQRKATDSTMNVLKRSKDLALAEFPSYTFLKDLPRLRRSIDTSYNFPANSVMEFYTSAILRINTLNPTTPASNVYLSAVYQDLIAQNILFQMITYLGIIKTNIYNVLHTRQNITETLTGTVSTHEIYNTYEAEFLLKASPFAVSQYNYIKASTELQPTIAYIDNLFRTFKFDSTYTADGWWTMSGNGINQLRKLQAKMWAGLDAKMNDIYKKNKREKNETLFFLMTAVVLIIVFISYTIKVITGVLEELKIAAQKISAGGTDIQLRDMPEDAIGQVANSILEINENNKKLADAADAIGKGNFKVAVAARSSDDLLGNSIVQMKNDLLQYSLQKDRIQNETMDLVNKKDDFMNIASHELKTPVTSLKAYTQILQMEYGAAGDNRNDKMFDKMIAQINKLDLLINDLLDTSKVREGALIYNRRPFAFNEMLKEVIDELQRTSADHKINLQNNPPVILVADKQRIGQVVSNLLTNALKYGPNADILVNAEVSDSKIICSVHDEGIGITKDQQDKVFDRFYRVSGQNLHTYPGLGLGLYISREIIQRHGGEIYVESEPGKGTTFYFTLPLAEE
ncbi:MAG: ATP-binding protein [Bacteroidota bacterium]|nr:ATP-binding protein [Bacteroidota bacterium]